MNTQPTSLYMKDNLGSIREWRIWVNSNIICIEYGILGGAMILQTEEVPYGKASRSREEQILSRVASRISRQRDRGYSNKIEDAKKPPTNLLGYKKPMLAKTIQSVNKISYNNAFIQPKLDGNRCLITNNNGELIAYSRNGKIINTIDHILEDINIPEGVTLDGELYCHGYPLQTIVSWIKRKQPDNLKIKYHVYDAMIDMSYKHRYYFLKNLDLKNATSLVNTYSVASYEECIEYFKMFRSNNYEGAIVRTDGVNYEDGKRSKSLLKIKEFHDDEFVVVDVKSSKDGWGVLECEMPNGKRFGVTAPGTIKNKTNILNNKNDYIGRNVTVEYSYITKDGIPFHPVALRFRDKE